MAGRFLLLVICAACIVSIESELEAAERRKLFLQLLRARIAERRALREIERNLTSLEGTSTSTPSSTLYPTVLLSQNGSHNIESKNDSNYDTRMSGEYMPFSTQNPDSFSRSTQTISSSPDVAVELQDNQTTSEEISRELDSAERKEQVRQILKARIAELQALREIQKNLSSLTETSTSPPSSTLYPTDLLVQNGSYNIEYKNDSNYDTNMSGEYVPVSTENPDSFSHVELDSAERKKQVRELLRARIAELQALREIQRNLTSLTGSSSGFPRNTLYPTDLLAQNGSKNVESKNNSNYDTNRSDDEYVPVSTENPVSDRFSHSTQDNSSMTDIFSSPDVATDLQDNQTTSEKTLIDGSSSTDVIDNLSTEQTELSKETSESTLLITNDDVTSSKEEGSSPTETDNSSTTFSSTINLASASTLSSTEKSDSTTPSAKVSEDFTNSSISSDQTVFTDKTDVTTLSEESTPPTSNEINNTSTETSSVVTTRDTTSTSLKPKEVTNEPTQFSTKITNTVTSSVYPSSSTSEEETLTTVTNHVKPIYNPTITTVKLALSITFMVIAFVGFVVLVSYMVKRKKQTIPYEELSLEP